MKKRVVLAIFVAMFFSMTSFCMKDQQEQIANFVYERDVEDVSKIIHDDWDQLLPHENFEDRENILNKELWEKNRTGELSIKVLRNKKRVMGLITFRKKTDVVGNVRIISFAEDFRGKGYERKLIIAVVDDLFDSGCTSAYLFTHKDNEKVKIYESLGFGKTEISQDSIEWFEKAGISADNYPKYVVDKKTFDSCSKK